MAEGPDALTGGTEALARRVAAETGAATPPPLAPEAAPAYLPAAPAGASRPASEQHLLRAWKDVHVRAQTHIAAIVLLALAGLALGFFFALD